MLIHQPTSKLAAAARQVRPVAPLLIVNAFAVLGQIFYGYDHYAPADWTPEARLGVAIGAAVGLESVALYVSWHAHDALLMGASATAARMRRAAYLIAFGVAAINYAHFSPDWVPTGAAIVFAGFSASSPWLWGLHTRRAHHIQLVREGQVDSTGAVFSAERWRAFPLRTYKARRWSIDLGVNDPREAWRGYNAAQPKPRPLGDAAGANPQSSSSNPSTLGIAEATNTPTVADLVAERAPLHSVPNATPTPPSGIPVVQPAKRVSPARTVSPTTRARVTELPPGIAEKAAPLIAQGYGRGRLPKELGITPTQARKLLDEHKARQEQRA